MSGKNPTDFMKGEIYTKSGAGQTQLNLTEMRIWSPLDICQGMHRHN